MIWIMIVACVGDGVKSGLEDTSSVEETTDTGASILDTAEEDTAVNNEAIQRFMALERVGEGARLVVGDIGDWSSREVLRETAMDSILRQKHGSIWLFERGDEERIVRYDPNDVSTSLAEYEFTATERVYPNDITLCGEYAFVTLYDGTDLLVLNQETLEEEGIISLVEYADDDGFPEASTLVCKKDFVYVSAHRFNRNEEEGGPWPQQLGASWIIFDPDTWTELALFADQGFRSEIFDVRETPYLGSVIAPHMDVSGTTGFWIFDPFTELYTSQIYFAWNDKTIFDTALGTNKAVHLATNYADDMTWMFCHDYTPEQDQPGYAYEELIPNMHEFVSLSINDADEGWLAFQTLDETPTAYVMSIDTQRCMSNNDEQAIENPIIDWEQLPNP